MSNYCQTSNELVTRNTNIVDRDVPKSPPIFKIPEFLFGLGAVINIEYYILYSKVKSAIERIILNT